MSIAAKIGCAPQTLNNWAKKAEVDSGKRRGISGEMTERMKALERENRELRQANGILRKAGAYSAMIEGSAELLQHCLRCSTAARIDGGFHRRALGCARGRADLRDAADRPCHLL
jgi:hypothetical protein